MPGHPKSVSGEEMGGLEKDQPFTPGGWLKKKVRSPNYFLMMSDLSRMCQIYTGVLLTATASQLISLHFNTSPTSAAMKCLRELNLMERLPSFIPHCPWDRNQTPSHGCSGPVSLTSPISFHSLLVIISIPKTCFVMPLGLCICSPFCLQHAPSCYPLT